jgi:hypothetical protein
MSQVDDEKEREALRKIAEGASELAKLQNRPLTKEEAEELTRRST